MPKQVVLAGKWGPSQREDIRLMAPQDARALATDEARRRLYDAGTPYDLRVVELLRLRDALVREAETLFGRRDTTWIIGPIRFSKEAFPRATRPDPNKNYIETWLSKCQTFPDKLTYQMAHEVIHLLAPRHAGVCPVIEEGLAVHFSNYVMSRINPNYDISGGPLPYERALEVYSIAHSINPNFILEYRKITPCFRDFTADLLVKFVPDLDLAVANMLCQPFDSPY